MARYTGAVCRQCRRIGEKLFLKGDRCSTPKCSVERDKRGMGPGMHTNRRRKVSERGTQLREKQKARYSYGVLERQFRRYFAEAERRPGMTGQNLMRILETRLDNVVYRLGFADSRNQARQLVNHGHFDLNGRKTDIASALVKSGDVVGVREKCKGLEYFKVRAQNITSKNVPTWLSIDVDQLSGKVLSLPSREDIDTRVNEQVIVEFYSR
ncbi:MAG: 30S ribosomal protein S4 [Dehalococcoidia bacterium]|nr:30S ribosomal protein S4 [Dehalococcoidia bacterium]